MAAETRWRKKDGLTVTDLGDEALVYDRANGAVHVLNRTARRIWSHCDGARSVAELADAITESWPEVSAADARRDVARLLAELLDKGLCEQAPGSSPTEPS